MKRGGMKKGGRKKLALKGDMHSKGGVGKSGAGGKKM